MEGGAVIYLNDLEGHEGAALKMVPWVRKEFLRAIIFVNGQEVDKKGGKVE